jgi:O-antigen ligase
VFLKLHKFLIIYFIISAFSLFYAANFKLGIIKLTDYLPFIIFPFCFSLLPKLEQPKLKYIIRLVYVYGVLFVLTFLFFNAVYKNSLKGNSIVQFIYSFTFNLFNSDYQIHSIEFWYFTYEGLTSIIGLQPIYLSLFVNLAYVFLINLKENKKIPNSIFYSLNIIYLLFIILISSRSGLLVYFTIGLMYFIFYKPKSIKKFILNTSIFILFIFFSGFVFLSNPITKDRILSVISNEYKAKSSNFSNQSIRFEIWKSAITLIRKSPIFGYSIGDYEMLLSKTHENQNFDKGFENKYNAHNQYLETTLQIGVFGLFFLLLLFINGFVYSFRTKNIEYTLILLTFTISFLTESMFNRQWGIVSFTLFICFTTKYALVKNI